MPSSSRYLLRQWIWRAFVQSALIPLILVESVLIAVYLLSNQAIRDEQVAHLQQTAVRDLASAAQEPSGAAAEHLDLRERVHGAGGEDRQDRAVHDADMVGGEDDRAVRRHVDRGVEADPDPAPDDPAVVQAIEKALS